MNIVIDLQGLKDKNNSFVPKEVAIISLDTPYIGHWLVAPPHEYAKLSPPAKRQNAWLKRAHHGLAWAEGDTPLREIEIILKKVAEQADRIFTRGSIKSEYLTNLTGCFIINLEEDEEAPSFRNLRGDDTRCIYHGLLRNNGMYKCSLGIVKKIKEWLCHSERIDSLWEYRTTTTWCVGSPCNKEKKPARKKPTDTACYEQLSNSTSFEEYTEPRGGRIPSRSYTEGVDETDSLRG